MKYGKFTALLLLLIIMVGSVAAFAYESTHTPEYALKEIAEGIEERDYDKVCQYADLSALTSTSYDESTAILCQEIEKLSRMYPQDWFFRHDFAFMSNYIAQRRDDDLVFIQRAMELYLDPDITPVSRADGEAKWIADETQKFIEEYDASVVKVEEEGNHAIAVIAITGHDSAYGRLCPKLTLRVELEPQEDGRWKAVRVSNVKELFYPVVDGIENYWTMQGWQ